MTIEEKKAIKELKHYCNLTQYWKNVEYAKCEFDDYINTVLQVIEKQQKEIEEKSEAPKYLYNAHTGEITRLDNSNYISKDKLKELMNKYEYFGDLDFEIELYKLLEEKQ